MGKKTIIYIRHGSDERQNHKYDEELTREGKEEAKKIAKKLIEEYGLPDVIYYSPFYRTRQTRKAMMHTIKKYVKDESELPVLKLEPRLGRFFTKKQSKNPDIRNSTSQKGAIIYETWNEFETRVTQQYEEIKQTKDIIIWNITHTLVLLQISFLSQIERNKHVNYLDYCVVKS